MKKWLLPVAVALAGCGVDGEPVRPSMTATLGVGDSGVHTATHVSATKGNLTLGVGLGS